MASRNCGEFVVLILSAVRERFFNMYLEVTRFTEISLQGLNSTIR